MPTPNPFLLMIGCFAIVGCSQSVKTQESSTEKSSYYTEKYRPQYHFTPEANWMNDPNGMVNYEGEYHLFYQYYPDSTVWGPMHWGHAVSTDLVSWEHLPIALYPDSLGLIFSGSAVIDWNNTSGFGTDEEPPMIAIFTHHLMEGEKAGRTDFQYQSIAYSLDKGRNWTKYEGNPVLPNQGIKDFRDPKVFWHEPTQKWIMTLAVFDHVEFYSSADFKSWDKLSDFGLNEGRREVLWECPDLFPMQFDGKTKWVLLVSVNPGGPNGGSSTQYFIGDFDGTDFKNDNSPETILWLDYGTDNYAGVTWSDIPEEDGRRLFIGWMSNWLYAQIVPTEKWRSAMTIPRELSLSNTADGYIIKSKPILELNQLRSKTMSLEQTAVERSLKIETDSLDINKAELAVTFSGINSDEFGIRLSNGSENVTIGFDAIRNKYFIDRTQAGNSGFHQEFAQRQWGNRLVDDTVELRIFVDASSIELFADDGATVLTVNIFPLEPYRLLEVLAKNGSVNLDEFILWELNSIWR
ncbi:MAG: glycoside hydrolase family 32 protein [Cyclobacteriaceae bacterium]